MKICDWILDLAYIPVTDSFFNVSLILILKLEVFDGIAELFNGLKVLLKFAINKSEVEIGISIHKVTKIKCLFKAFDGLLKLYAHIIISGKTGLLKFALSKWVIKLYFALIITDSDRLLEIFLSVFIMF